MVRISELDRLFLEMERERRDMIAEAARNNPKAHKLTRVFPTGKSTNYKYYPAGLDGRGWTVRFCWSNQRNAAGYFLGWRELIPPRGSKAKHGGKRDQWVARKVKRRAEELALKRAARHAEKFGNDKALKDITHWQERLDEKKRKASERMKARGTEHELGLAFGNNQTG